MVARFQFSVDGIKELDRAFDRFADAVKDWKPAWRKTRTFLYKHERKIFSTRGFGTWAPLASGQAATLMQSKRMKRSLTQRGGENIAELAKETLLFGSRVTSDAGAPYPLFHQRGTRKMPQRRIIFLREEERREILKIMQRHAVDIVKKFRKDAKGVSSVSGA